MIHSTSKSSTSLPMKVFAYLTSIVNTVMTVSDRWYIFQGTFNNTFNDNFTLGSDGIIADISGYVEVSWMCGGTSNTAGDIKIGIVKNGTFTVDGSSMYILDSGEGILPGSGGKDFADKVGAPNGEVNPRCNWAGYIEAGDKLTLVVASTSSSTTLTPDGASASLHSIN